MDITNPVKFWFGLALLWILAQKCKKISLEQKIPNRTKMLKLIQHPAPAYNEKSLDTFGKSINMSFNICKSYSDFQTFLRKYSKIIYSNTWIRIKWGFSTKRSNQWATTGSYEQTNFRVYE